MIRRRFLKALASVTIVSATLLPTSAKASTPPGIKASAVLAKAQSMLGVKYVYGGNDPKAGLDCSAYVSHAWAVSRHTTDTIQNVSRSITKDELLPGDALNHSLAGRVGHIRIFDKWATTDKALVWAYEATPPAVVHHVVPYDPRFKPIRRLNIDSDVPMPPPPPLPEGKTYTPPPAPVAADGALVGQIVGEQSGKPLSGARFFYWAAEDQYRVQSIITDNEGRFAIPRLPATTYEIAAYASGHNVEMDGRVIVTGNRTTVVELRLARATSGSNETRLQSGTSTILTSGAALTTAPTSLPQDYPIPGGHFYTQAAGGDGISGFGVTNEAGVPFWDEFRRLGGVGGLGYPVSRRFVWQGFTVQVMQKGVLQWRPEVAQAWLTNVFDELSAADKDAWLQVTRSTPPPLPGSFDAGRDWDAVVTARLALLDANPAMRARYHAAADPLTFFGLPTSAVTDQGNHHAIRLQRAVLQHWKVDVPWAKAGQVTVANGGDVAKEAGIFPAAVLQPQRSPLIKSGE